MKILELRVLKGPNYWSVKHHRLIQMKLDIGVYEKLPTHLIPGFKERLVALLPSLQTHRCSPGYAGGFLERVKEGTWLGHVIEHVALELQTLAGMDCGFGRTRSASGEGVYNVVFSYVIEDAGRLAAEAAVRLVTALAGNTVYDMSKDMTALRDIYNSKRPGPSTAAILQEAERRGIPVLSLNDGCLYQLGYGANQKLIRASMTDGTSALGVDIAGDKQETKDILSAAYVPVPAGGRAATITELEQLINAIGFPLTIKPVDGNHGRNVRTNIKDRNIAKEAFIQALKTSGEVVVEAFISGNDFRILVVDGKMVAAARRNPASVTGDGIHTVAQLVSQLNEDPLRGIDHENALTRVQLDACSLAVLKQYDMTTQSVPAQGQKIYLKDSANLSSGGTAEDVTDTVHPHNRLLAERIARLLHLDICGIDIICKDIRQPIKETNGAVIEVNACPGLRMHLHPSLGQARNVAAPIISMLFPIEKNARIPIVAVTGTNGKTTTTRLVAHLAMQRGYNVGYTTTDGVFLNRIALSYGDCSGPASAQVLLRDPMVDFAVFECARGGMLRSGLGFDHCDISIVTNVTEDHLGLGDIETLEQMAKLKAVVPESTRKSGYAILNADDPLVLKMREQLHCQTALFSLHGNNTYFKAHIDEGGLGIFLDEGQLVVSDQCRQIPLIAVEDIPLTFGGTSSFMLQNVMGAVLAAYASGFDLITIVEGLKTFKPSVAMTPGRMNRFELGNFTFFIDYMHNSDGYKQVKSFLDLQEARRKVGIISATGDRRKKDVVSLGAYAAAMFDEIIINNDHDNRGRSNDELTAWMKEGISTVNSNCPVYIAANEKQSIDYALGQAVEGDLIFASVDKIFDVINYLEARQNEYHSKQAVDTVILSPKN